MKRTLTIAAVLVLVMIAVMIPVNAAESEFKNEGGVWHYYLDDVMQTDAYAKNSNNKNLFYYFDKEGKGSIFTGYYDNKYFEQGVIAKNKIVVAKNGYAYKCDSKGKATPYTGVYKGVFYQKDGKQCNVTKKSQLVKFYEDGDSYYVNKEGKIYQPEKYGKYEMDNGYCYYIYSSGKAEAYTGIYKGVYYWKNGSPAKVKSRKRLVKFYDKYYYVNKNGKIYDPEKSGSYKMDNGKRYYIYYTGKVKKVNEAGIYKANGKPYYFYDGSNIRYKKKAHWWKKNGKLYRVSSDGRIVTGFFKVGGHKYYAKKSKYYLLKDGIFTINGYKYWLDKKGRIYTKKWRMKNKGKYQYFNSNGVMLRNQSAYVGKYKFFFNKKGVVQKDLFKYKGLKWVKKQSIQIAVNRKKNVITFMAKDGKKGYTIPVYACLCSVGTPDHPTPLETTYTSPKRTHRWMRLGGPHINTALCWGQYVVHYNGRRYFHSCCYNSKNIRNLVTYNYNYLGRAASHGCIRMRAVDAKRLYTLAKYKRLQVKVYSSSVAGPFGKPIYKKIPAGQKYDPTDPNL